MKIPSRLIAIHAAALLTLSLSVNAVAGQDPLELIKNVPLPHVTGGDFDHFAVDLKKNRLYVPSEVYASIEVFNLKTGDHLKSATGLVKSPHMLALMPDKKELFVADAQTASRDVLDAADLHLLKRIALEPGPDFGVYDDTSKILYIGNGGESVHSA